METKDKANQYACRCARLKDLDEYCMERNKTEVVHDASSNHFFIFSLYPSLLSPRRSFLIVPPSSLPLFLPSPALSKSFRIRESLFFIDFDESITDRPTDQPTNRRTRPLIEMRTHLKTIVGIYPWHCH